MQQACNLISISTLLKRLNARGALISGWFFCVTFGRSVHGFDEQWWEIFILTLFVEMEFFSKLNVNRYELLRNLFEHVQLKMLTFQHKLQEYGNSLKEQYRNKHTKLKSMVFFLWIAHNIYLHQLIVRFKACSMLHKMCMLHKFVCAVCMI